MSFEVLCPHCGAASGPSVGMCPFCKAVLSRAQAEGSPSLKRIGELYDSGALEQALLLAAAAEKETIKPSSFAPFCLLYAKILLETEGPGSKVRSLLARAALASPHSGEANEYLQLVDAKGKLRPEYGDAGEKALRALLARSPANVHGLFLLGSHLHWVQGRSDEAVPLLERCVELRPNFLRAWACLAAIYLRMKHDAQAKRALHKCLTLETHPALRQYFERLLAA